MELVYRLRDPDKGYVSNNLLLPKHKVNVRSIKNALEFPIGETEELDEETGEFLRMRVKLLRLWDENAHHLVVPRSFISSEHMEDFRFDFVHDPAHEAPFVPWSCVTDPRDEVQQEALSSISDGQDGILNLACVTKDTVLDLNRGGRDFRTTIKTAYERTEGLHGRKYSWDPDIPTYIQSMIGEEIRLNRVVGFLYKGARPTWKLELEDGNSVRTTEDHEIMTPRGPIELRKLEVGDEVWVDNKAPSGRKRKATKVRRIGECRGEEVYDVICEPPHRNYVAGGVVVHNCGKGKTIVSLMLAPTFRAPIIVVVNSKNLIAQWGEEIRTHLRVDGKVPEIGLVQGKTHDWKGKPIVIATVQSLAMKRDTWQMEFRKYFGLAIYDEAHHMSAPIFVQAADLFFCKRLALTATANRTDGLEAIYKYHLGHVRYKNLGQDLIPDTIFHVLKWKMPRGDIPHIRDVNGEFNTSKARTYIGSLPWRNRIVCTHISQALEEGRNILVLSHSKDNVIALASEYGENNYIVGDISDPEERHRILRECNPVFGTFQLAREALNKPELDSLFIVTVFGNSNDLQQSWGRTQRERAGKRTPVIHVYEDDVTPLKLSPTDKKNTKPLDTSIRSCRELRRHLKALGYPFKRDTTPIP